MGKIIIEQLYDYYNKKLRNDSLSGTITTNSNFSGSGVMLVIERINNKNENGQDKTSN